MTQIEAVKAYAAAKALNQQTLTGFIAKKIFTLTQKLQPCWDFEMQEEKKIYEKYPTYDPNKGVCRARDRSEEAIKEASEEAEAVSKDLKELQELEIEPINFEKFTILLENENIKISGEEIGSLAPFIDFE